MGSQAPSSLKEASCSLDSTSALLVSALAELSLKHLSSMKGRKQQKTANKMVHFKGWEPCSPSATKSRKGAQGGTSQFPITLPFRPWRASVCSWFEVSMLGTLPEAPPAIVGWVHG